MKKWEEAWMLYGDFPYKSCVQGHGISSRHQGDLFWDTGTSLLLQKGAELTYFRENFEKHPRAKPKDVLWILEHEVKFWIVVGTLTQHSNIYTLRAPPNFEKNLQMLCLNALKNQMIHCQAFSWHKKSSAEMRTRTWS